MCRKSSSPPRWWGVLAAVGLACPARAHAPLAHAPETVDESVPTVSYGSMAERIGSLPTVQVTEASARSLRESAGALHGFGRAQLQMQTSPRLIGPGQRGIESQWVLFQPWQPGAVSSQAQSLRSEAQVFEAEARALRLERRERAQAAWIEVWAARQEVELLTNAASEADDWAHRLGELAHRHEVSSVDEAQARVDAAQARLTLLAAQGRVFDASVLLGQTLGLPRALPSGDPPAFSESDQPVSTCADVRVVQARRAFDRCRASLTELLSSGSTTWMLGAGGVREPLGGVSPMVSLQVDAPRWDGHRRESAALKAECAALEAELQSARIQSESARLQRAHEREHASETWQVARDELVADASRMVQSVRRAWEAHEATWREFVLARRADLEARRTELQARAGWMVAESNVRVWDAASEGPCSEE